MSASMGDYCMENSILYFYFLNIYFYNYNANEIRKKFERLIRFMGIYFASVDSGFVFSLLLDFSPFLVFSVTATVVCLDFPIR